MIEEVEVTWGLKYGPSAWDQEWFHGTEAGMKEAVLKLHENRLAPVITAWLVDEKSKRTFTFRKVVEET